MTIFTADSGVLTADGGAQVAPNPTLIVDYPSLQTVIASFLNRADLAAYIPQFISLAEAKFQRNMRCWQMVTRATANTLVSPNATALWPQGEYLPLPKDYLELKRARVMNADCPQDALDYAPGAAIDELQVLNQQGNVPSAYNIVGNALRLGPCPDKQYAIEVTYYAKLPKLSNACQTNWLLAEHPDYYLYASLLQAAPYLKDDDRIPVWQSFVGEAEGPNGGTGILGELKTANERGERAGERIKTRLRRAYGSSF